MGKKRLWAENRKQRNNCPPCRSTAQKLSRVLEDHAEPTTRIPSLQFRLSFIYFSVLVVLHFEASLAAWVEQIFRPEAIAGNVRFAVPQVFSSSSSPGAHFCFPVPTIRRIIANF
jgi:hypothetical protein